MSMTLLAVVVLALTAAVVVAIFLVLWRERTSARESRIAVVSGVVLAAWAIVATMLARRGFFQPPDLDQPATYWDHARSGAPRVGCVPPRLSIVASPSHESKKSDPSQPLATGRRRLPDAHGQRSDAGALGIASGDWRRDRWCDGTVDRRAASTRLRADERAIIFNLFGMADLVVAVGLGVMTSPGPAQVFHTTPTSELATRFPLALVPTFLVPLAFVLHVISLWQLLGGTWVPHPVASPGRSR